MFGASADPHSQICTRLPSHVSHLEWDPTLGKLIVDLCIFWVKGMESLEGFSLSWCGFSAVLKVSCAGPLFKGLLGKAKLDALCVAR